MLGLISAARLSQPRPGCRRPKLISSLALLVVAATTLVAFCVPTLHAYTFPPFSPVPANFDRKKCGEWKRFTLIFLHMQKCGGTSVEVSLRQFAWMCGIGYMRYPGVKKSWASSLKSGKVNIVTGHNFYGIHKHLPPNRKYAYVTALREPVPRLISHFHHRGPKDCGFNCSLWQYGKMSGNYYVRHLITQSSPLDPRKDARKIATGLAVAQSNLNKMEVVGVLSDISEWFAAVQQMLRVKVRLGMELPQLGFQNVRDLETVAVKGATASKVQLLESLPTKGKDTSNHYPQSLMTRLESMMKADYSLWHTAQALALKHNATSGSSSSTADVDEI